MCTSLVIVFVGVIIVTIATISSAIATAVARIARVARVAWVASGAASSVISAVASIARGVRRAVGRHVGSLSGIGCTGGWSVSSSVSPAVSLGGSVQVGSASVSNGGQSHQTS